MNAIDRRRVLSLSAAALAGAALPACATGASSATRAGAPGSAAKARRLRKALGIGMIGAGTTLLEKFQLARDCGFVGIEMDGPSGHRREDVLAARDATGLTIPSVVDSVHWEHNLASADPEVRRRGREGLLAALDDAHAYGAKSVLLVPCQVNKEVAYDAAWQRSQAEIRAVLPRAAELGVRIAVENVWNNFILSPLEARRYLEELDSPWVGWHLDLGNLVIYGWPEQWVRVLGPRILQLHVKEYSRKKLDEVGRWAGFDVELGDGDDDWPAIMRALDEIGYDGWGIAEVGGGDAARLRDVSARMDRCFAG